ncbi:MAG: hypothetical protein Q8P67_06480 [archaeon]|nr:hypothetical protein [archaeon]
MKVVLLLVLLAVFAGFATAHSHTSQICDNCDGLWGKWSGYLFTRAVSTADIKGPFPLYPETFSCLPSFVTPPRAPISIVIERDPEGNTWFKPHYHKGRTYKQDGSPALTRQIRSQVYEGDVVFAQPNLLIDNSNGQLTLRTSTGNVCIPYTVEEDGQLVFQFTWNYATSSIGTECGNGGVVNLDVTCHEGSQTANYPVKVQKNTKNSFRYSV